MTEKKPTRIIRAPHASDFFLMTRTTAQDVTLSYEALGVLTYLLSKPDSWEINVKDLSKRSSSYKVYKILHELRTAGYVTLEKETGEGRFSQWVYQVYETSQLLEFQEVEIQQVEIQDTQRIQNDSDNTEKKSRAKKRVSKIPNSKPVQQRKHDPMWDAIAKVWNTIASGQIACMKSMMLGTAKRGMWKTCNFEPAATPDEVLAFETYAHKRMKSQNLTELPTASVTIQRWFYDYRASLKSKISDEKRAHIESLRQQVDIPLPLARPA